VPFFFFNSGLFLAYCKFVLVVRLGINKKKFVVVLKLIGM
jgi:hypothetical protein